MAYWDDEARLVAELNEREKQTQGIKHDQDKFRYDLVNPSAHASFVSVLTYGAKKYGDRNWEKGIDYNRLIAATYRHIESFRLGEKRDPESNNHHIAHAMANLHFILAFERDMNLPRNNEPPVPKDSSEVSSEVKEGKEALRPDSSRREDYCLWCKRFPKTRRNFCDLCLDELATKIGYYIRENKQLG